jgi:hypothetical protein
MSAITFTGVLEGLAPISWSVVETFRGWSLETGFGDWFDTRFAADDEVVATVTDDSDTSISTPTMLAGPRERDHAKSRPAKVTWMDKTSWLLSSGSQSWDTFLAPATTATILAAVASRFGVSITGPTPWDIYAEDFKLVNGWAVLDRIERASGGDITVGTDNSLVFRAAGWTSGPSSFKPTTVKDHYDPLARYGRIFVSKNLGTGTAEGPQYYTFTAPGVATQELSFPLGPGAYPEYVSSVGTVTIVTLYDGPPDSGGQAIVTHFLDGSSGDGPDPTGSWPATHLVATIEPDTTGSTAPFGARLKVSGSAYSDLPAGIDGAIAQEFGSGRGAPFAFSDSLIPDLAFATARHPYWLARANRGTNTMTATGPLDCSVRVGQTWGWAPWGLAGRIEQVKHSGGGRAPTTEIIVNCDVEVS